MMTLRVSSCRAWSARNSTACASVTVTYAWRGGLDNLEMNRLHAEAFDAPEP